MWANEIRSIKSVSICFIFFLKDIVADRDVRYDLLADKNEGNRNNQKWILNC